MGTVVTASVMHLVTFVTLRAYPGILLSEYTHITMVPYAMVPGYGYTGTN